MWQDSHRAYSLRQIWGLLHLYTVFSKCLIFFRKSKIQNSSGAIHVWLHTWLPTRGEKHGKLLATVQTQPCLIAAVVKYSLICYACSACGDIFWFTRNLYLVQTTVRQKICIDVNLNVMNSWRTLPQWRGRLIYRSHYDCSGKSGWVMTTLVRSLEQTCWLAGWMANYGG